MNEINSGEQPTLVYSDKAKTKTKSKKSTDESA